MKIKPKLDLPEIEFEKLKVMDCFRYDSSIFLKSNDSLAAFCLNNGCCRDFDLLCMVTPYDCSLTLTPYTSYEITK